MRYKSFRIMNYKAIKDLTIEINKPNLIPIIGLNETGKSSILQAMFAFDFTNDSQYNGEFINTAYIRNKFDTKTFPVIEAILENFDRESLIQEALNYIMKNKEEDFIKKSRYRGDSNFKKNSYLEPIKFSILEKIKNLFSNDIEEIKIIRTFEDTPYYKLPTFDFKEIRESVKVNGLGQEEITIEILKNEFERLVVESIVSLLPRIIYIDDFKDIVPEEIKKGNQWYPYINEIFKKNKEDIFAFSKKSLSDRQTVLGDIKDELNSSLAELWDQMHASKTIRNEFKTVEIDLRYENDTFQFLINDLREVRESGRVREVSFPVHMRSKGFQWFFNFFIKMKYNWKHINDENYGSIILLDEPGVYLHTTFQTELVKVLKDLSKDNVVFYTTHLENMTNPKVIKISQINVAKRDKEKIILEKITKIEDNKNLGEITPIINALKIENFPLVHLNEKIIITEEITDKIFLTMLQEAEMLDKNIKIIPGSGVSNLGTLISLSIGITDKYVVLFDNDAAGREHFENYKKEFGENESRKWILHKIPEKKDDVVLEDYYNDEMRQILEIHSDNKDYKIGLINLYYSDNEENKRNFYNELKKLSKKDKPVSILINQINKRL